MYTSHGHHIPGTDAEPTLDSAMFLPLPCGGAMECRACGEEAMLEIVRLEAEQKKEERLVRWPM